MSGKQTYKNNEIITVNKMMTVLAHCKLLVHLIIILVIMIISIIIIVIITMMIIIIIITIIIIIIIKPQCATGKLR